MALSQTTPQNSAQSSKVNREVPRELIERAFSDAYESLASKPLLRYFPKEAFRLDVSIGLGTTPKRIPYMSQSAYLKTLSIQPLYRLRRHISRVDVRVFLSNRIPQQSEPQIRDILTKTLQITPNDSISFSDLNMEYEVINQETERAIISLENRLSNLNQELGKVTRERNDVKAESTNLKISLDKEIVRNTSLEERFSDVKRKHDDLQAAAEKRRIEDEKVPKKKETFMDHPYFIGGLIGSAVLSVILILVMLLSARRLATSHGQVADSLNAIGSALQVSSQESSSNVLPGVAETKELSSTESERISSADHGSLAVLQSRVVEMHDQLVPLVTKANFPTVIAHISSLLRNDETIESGVATMELMGANKANEIFASLGKPLQQTIRNFLGESKYREGKALALYNAGESLITLLTMENISASFEGENLEIRNFISQLEFRDISSVCEQISGEVLSRLFLYLDTAALTQIIDNFAASKQGDVRKYVEAVAGMASVNEKSELDDDLKNVLSEVIHAIESDEHRQYLDLYVNLANRLEDNTSKLLKDTLSSLSREVGNYLESEVVNTATFYKITDDLRRDVLASLSNAQIAALTIELEGEYLSEWMTVISDRRAEAVVELRDQLSSQSELKISTEKTDAKTALKSVLMSFKSKGQLAYREEGSARVEDIDEVQNVA